MDGVWACFFQLPDREWETCLVRRGFHHVLSSRWDFDVLYPCFALVFDALLGGVSVMHLVAGWDSVVCVSVLCAGVWWGDIVISGSAWLDRYSFCVDIMAQVLTIARDVVVPGNEVVLWVGLIEVCAAAPTPWGRLAMDAYDGSWCLVCFAFQELILGGSKGEMSLTLSSWRAFSVGKWDVFCYQTHAVQISQCSKMGWEKEPHRAHSCHTLG
jgi:hypothetical protein